jgi:L-alanine-DL-glutamate epimerase-like enolase superfamily enzyme
MSGDIQAMKIISGKVYPVAMPFEDKDWKFALAAINQSDGFFLKLETDQGITGWGCTAAANHIGENRGSVLWGLEQIFLPFLINKDPLDIEPILTGLDRLLFLNPRAKTAVDLALHDLVGKVLNVPLYTYLGGKVRDAIPIIRLVPLKEPEEQAAVCRKLVDEGYRGLKIKLSGDMHKDVLRVKTVREEVGSSILLTVDANQSYDPLTAVKAIRAMEPYDIYLFEQPVRYDDIVGLSYVTHRVDIKVDADESAKTLGDIIHLIREQAVTSISLKIPKLGGIRNTKKAAAICAAAGMPCRIGDALGSRLFAAANIHVIASTPNLGLAAEAAEFMSLENDPVSGIEVINGSLSVPEKPGLGLEVTGFQ